VTSRFRTAVAALVAFGLGMAPRVAEACSVCSSGRDDETRTAFIATTAFMTFLPLGMGAGIFVWLRRRFRAIEGEVERRDRLEAAPEVVRLSSSPR